MRMSMEGDGVVTNSRSAMSYTPLPMKSVSTLFSFDAQTRRPSGTPIRFA